MKLEDQLKVAKEELAQRQREVAEVTKKHRSAIAAAEKRFAAASKKSQSAITYKHRVQQAAMIRLGFHTLEGKFSPEYLDRAAKFVGVHYRDRAAVGITNCYGNDKYEYALDMAMYTAIERVAEVVAARRLCVAADATLQKQSKMFRFLMSQIETVENRGKNGLSSVTAYGLRRRVEELEKKIEARVRRKAIVTNSVKVVDVEINVSEVRKKLNLLANGAEIP